MGLPLQLMVDFEVDDLDGIVFGEHDVERQASDEDARGNQNRTSGTSSTAKVAAS